MEVLLALLSFVLAPTYSQYISSYYGYGTTGTLPYYYGSAYQYGYPSYGTTAYVYPTYGYTGATGYGYPAYGYTGTTGYGYPYGTTGYGYPYGYPYGTGTGTGTIGTGTGTGIVGDPTGGTGVGVITGTAPGGTGVITGTGTGTGTGIVTGTGVVGTGGVLGTGGTGIIGATGLTSSTGIVVGAVIPGTLNTGDTLVVNGIAPSGVSPGLGPNDSVWSVNLLSAAQATLCSMAVKNGWTRFTISAAPYGWGRGWVPATPAIQTCPFQPSTPYTMQITNQPTGLQILINNMPYSFPHLVGGGVNVYNSLGFIGYDKGQLCSATLIRGGVSQVIAVGSGSSLCGTGIGK